ncbi:hypothetical protein ACMAZF_20350 (plasmid) [Psychrobium sp. nBUS_13]
MQNNGSAITHSAIDTIEHILESMFIESELPSDIEVYSKNRVYLRVSE